MLVRINLIRHGMTKSNMERRFVGILDEPLVNEGIEGVKSIWNNREPIANKLYVSPMIRCRQTAEIIYPSQEQFVFDDLRECNFGIFEGKNYDEIIVMPEYLANKSQGMMGDMPNGEKNADFISRTNNVFNEIVGDAVENNFENVTVVCHGGVIMSIMSTIFPSENGFYDYHVDNGRGYAVNYNKVTKQFSIIQGL